MRFVSKVRDLRLIMRPQDRTMDDQRREIQIPGKKVEFFNFNYTTEDEEMIKWLFQHPLRNSEFGVADDEKDVKAWIAQHSVTPMISGAGDSVTVSRLPEGEGQVIVIQKESQNESMEDMVDRKITVAMEKILAALKETKEIHEEKPKKKFTCPFPGCGQDFNTGFAVGKHKREHGTISPEQGGEMIWQKE